MSLTLVIGSKRYSSWSLRPWLAMKVTGIPFREVFVPLRQPTTAAALRRHSPSAKVPVLKAGDETVWESLAILEYLADRYPSKGLWPKGRGARGHARAAAAEMHAGFGALRTHMPMDIGKTHEGQGMGPGVAANIHRIDTLWSECRKRYGRGGPFLFGAFGNADAMYAPVASRFATYGVTLSGEAQSYCDALLALPEMQTWAKAAAREPELAMD